MAFGGVITNPKKILLTGPQINEIDYNLPADPVAAQSPDHAIMGNELSLDVATYNTFAADVHLTTGKDPGFSDVGLEYNMLRAVINNTHTRRALLYLQDFSYYQNTMLSGVEGIATPTYLPCVLYTASCTNGPHRTAAENIYGGLNLQKAIAELKLTQSDPNPNSRLFQGNTSNIVCDTSGGAVCSNLEWHIGSAAGPIWTPNWVGRGSLHRGDIAVHVIAQAHKIGLDMASHYTQFGPRSVARQYEAAQQLASVIQDGVYISSGPNKGYNTAPVYNYSRSTPAACPGVASKTANCWDLYSYGFGFTGPALFADAQFTNSAFGSSGTNAPLYYNRTMDKASNGVLYATTVSAALASAAKVALYDMQNLPWQNVFFENTLWAVLSDVWTGYADVPTQGPNSLSGLFYTLLNVHLNCFPVGCMNGGTLKYGLYQSLDTPGGATPMAQFNSVYDADITNQIFEGPTIVGPTQFNSPGKYTNWMLSYNGKPAQQQSPVLQIKASAFNGMTGSGAGWTDFQLASSATTLSNAAQKISHGQRFTLKFDPNIYFHDHVRMTSADYNFSLYVSNIALSPTLPDELTPFAGALSGPSGLIATHIVDPLTIEIYVNSTTALNPLNIIVPVIPEHIFRYFNVNSAWSEASTFDTSFNYNSTILVANGCVGCVAANAGAPPFWLQSLPNLEVGTGPFILRSWVGGETQAGILLRNVNYYRANWAMNDTNNQVKKGNSFTYSRAISEWTYSETACSASPDKVCQIPITSGISAHLDLLNKATGAVLATFPLVCNGAGVCSGSISTAGGFKIGDNELALTATYTYLGLARTWYELSGVLVHP